MTRLSRRAVGIASGAVLAIFVLASVGLLAPHARSLSEAKLVALASALEAAVASADPVRVEALTAPNVRNDYQWVREWPQSGMTNQPWRSGLLRWRSERTARELILIHISRPQVTQSTDDHLYEIAGTSAAPRLGAEVPATELVGAHVTAHDLDVEFMPEQRRVTVRDTASVRRAPSRLGIALYRLNSYWAVSELLVNGKAAPYARGGGFLVTDVPPSEQATLTVQSSVTLPSAGESYVGKDEAAITAYWYVHTARQPFTARTRISAPAGWRSISTGVLMHDERAPHRWTSVWKNDLPICFMMAVAGRYQVTAQTAGRSKVSCWLLEASQDRSAAGIRAASEALQWFGSHFAPFPYPEYTVVESRIFPPALEGYSFTLVGSAGLPGVVTHEVSHTWWGGLVPNTYLRSMWNEAFATYSESLFSRLRSSNPPDPGEGALSAARQLPDRPTILHATDAMHPDHGAIGYQKGALVLGQLERIIGTQTMLRTLREFVQRHRPGESAEWADYVRVVEEVAGSAGKNILQPWLEQPGLPHYQLTDITVSTDGPEYRIRGAVETARPVRPCRAEVRIVGQDSHRDIEVILREPRTPFEAHLTFRPTQAVFDPLGRVPRRPCPEVPLRN